MKHEQAPPQAAPSDTQQPIDLLAEVEQRLSQLRKWQQDSDRHFEQAKQQAQAVALQEAAIQAVDRALQRRKARLASIRNAIRDRRRIWQQRQSELDALATQLQSQQAALEGSSAQVNQTRKELDERIVALQAQAEELQRNRVKLDEDQAALAQLQGQVAQQEAQARSAVEHAQREQIALASQREQAEKLRAVLDAKQREITELASQLASRQERFDAQRHEIYQKQEELEKLVERIAQEKMALERARVDAKAASEQANTQRAAELEQRIAELDNRAAELNLRQAELDGRSRQLTEQEKAFASGRAELKKQADDLARRVKEIDQRETEALRMLEQGKAELDRNQGRRREYEESLKAQALKIEGKIAQIKKADSVLKSRREKLHRYRKLLRDRSKKLRGAEDGVQSMSQQCQGLLQQRQMLLDVKQFLAASEQEMIRRWSTHHAGAVIAALVLTLAGLLVVSYAVGQRAVDPIWRTSVVLAIDSEDPQVMQDWLKAQQQAITSEKVCAETISLMDRHGVKHFAGASDLARHLKAHVAQRVEGKNRLLLEHLGADSESARLLLESLSRALVAFDLAQRSAAGEQAPAGPVTRIAQVALIDPKPVKDERLMYGGIIFGTSTLATALAALLLRFWLARSTRIFDQASSPAIDMLEDPKMWAQVNAGAK